VYDFRVDNSFQMGRTSSATVTLLNTPDAPLDLIAQSTTPTTFFYQDGKLRKVTINNDSAERVVHYDYDADGLIQSVLDKVDPDDSNLAIASHLSYDENKRLVQIDYDKGYVSPGDFYFAYSGLL